MEKEAERGRNKRGKKVFLESIEALSDPFSSPSIGIDLRRNTRAIGVDAESIKKGGVEREREREKKYWSHEWNAEIEREGGRACGYNRATQPLK